MLKELEEKCSVEAVAVPSESPDLRVSFAKTVKAVLEFAVVILLLDGGQWLQLAHEGHRLVDRFLQVILKVHVLADELRHVVHVLLLVAFH